MKHPLQVMMEKRRQGIRCGIPSYCSANELVLEIALRRAKLLNKPVLIEATANQVNQFGGYTGMMPKDFYQICQGHPRLHSCFPVRCCQGRRHGRYGGPGCAAEDH